MKKWRSKIELTICLDAEPVMAENKRDAEVTALKEVMDKLPPVWIHGYPKFTTHEMPTFSEDEEIYTHNGYRYSYTQTTYGNHESYRITFEDKVPDRKTLNEILHNITYLYQEGIHIQDNIVYYDGWID